MTTRTPASRPAALLRRTPGLALALALLVVALPGAAGAQTHNWSVVGTEVNTGKPFQDVRVGWPDVDFGYTFNLGPTSDMGIRFGFLYGVEGTTYSQFGMSLWAPLRWQVMKNENVRMLVHVDPGLRLYVGGSKCPPGFGGECFQTSSTMFGFAAPVGVVLGGQVAPGVEVGGGFDLNLALYVTSPVNLIIGPMVGPYVEYHFGNPDVAIGLNTRFGAAIPTAAGSSASFAFLVQAFAGYRLF